MMSNSQTCNGVFQNKKKRIRQQPSRERPVFPFAIIITQSSRSSISTLTNIHTETDGELFEFMENTRDQTHVIPMLRAQEPLRLRRPRAMDRRASLWISRRRGSWTIDPAARRRGVCARNPALHMLSCSDLPRP